MHFVDLHQLPCRGAAVLRRYMKSTGRSAHGGGKLTQACRRIGARRKRLNRCARAVVRRDFSGGGLRKAHSNIPVEMIFGAGRAISLARVLIALAGKFVTAANTITIAGFGSRFDGNKSHGVSPSKHSMGDGAARRGCDEEHGALLFSVHWFRREAVNSRGFSGGPGERASPGCPLVPASADRRCRGKLSRFSDRIGCRRNGEFPLWRETWAEPGGTGGR